MLWSGVSVPLPVDIEPEADDVVLLVLLLLDGLLDEVEVDGLVELDADEDGLL